MLLTISAVTAVLYVISVIINATSKSNDVPSKITTLIYTLIFISYLLIQNFVLVYARNFYTHIEIEYSDIIVVVLTILVAIQPIVYITSELVKSEKFTKYSFPVYTFLLLALCIAISITVALHKSALYDSMNDSILIAFIIPMALMPTIIYCNESIKIENKSNFISKLVINSLFALVCVLALIMTLIIAIRTSIINIPLIILSLILLSSLTGVICTIISYNRVKGKL